MADEFTSEVFEGGYDTGDSNEIAGGAGRGRKPSRDVRKRGRKPSRDVPKGRSRSVSRSRSRSRSRSGSRSFSALSGGGSKKDRPKRRRVAKNTSLHSRSMPVTISKVYKSQWGEGYRMSSAAASRIEREAIAFAEGIIHECISLLKADGKQTLSAKVIHTAYKLKCQEGNLKSNGECNSGGLLRCAVHAANGIINTFHFKRVQRDKKDDKGRVVHGAAYYLGCAIVDKVVSIIDEGVKKMKVTRDGKPSEMTLKERHLISFVSPDLLVPAKSEKPKKTRRSRSGSLSSTGSKTSARGQRKSKRKGQRKPKRKGKFGGKAPRRLSQGSA